MLNAAVRPEESDLAMSAARHEVLYRASRNTCVSGTVSCRPSLDKVTSLGRALLLLSTVACSVAASVTGINLL
ncbi:hypothetical protein WJX73_006355 [Symbiochloris irregularis]|uniref:Uncharacterized protein n=1 Tax=Symbiochloris irregularis TaxID=706552 RepID=A0AAW1NU87_9CHLO